MKEIQSPLPHKEPVAQSQHLRWLLGRTKGDRVLVTSAHDPMTLVLFARKGYTCLCADPDISRVSRARIEIAKEDSVTRSRVEFKHSSSIEPAEGLYPVIIVGDDLAYESSPHALLTSLSQSLARDGVLLVYATYGYGSIDQPKPTSALNLLSWIPSHLALGEMRLLDRFIVAKLTKASGSTPAGSPESLLASLDELASDMTKRLLQLELSCELYMKEIRELKETPAKNPLSRGLGRIKRWLRRTQRGRHVWSSRS